MSTTGTVVGGAILAVLLAAVPPDEPESGYTTDCVGSAAMDVQPDTAANRQAAAAWCAFEAASPSGHFFDGLRGKR